MDATLLASLYRHMEWADATVWTSVLACGGANGDEKLREILHHIHRVQRAFLGAWSGAPLDMAPPAFETLAELSAWGRTYHAEVADHLQAVSPDALARPMVLPWATMVEQAIGRAPDETTMADTLFQVAMHSHYHRGQVNLRLRELGGEPPLVDYIAWLWFGRPEARWPSTA